MVIGRLGRPRENYQGYLSKRIMAGHGLVYKIIKDIMVVAQCRLYY